MKHSSTIALKHWFTAVRIVVWGKHVASVGQGRGRITAKLGHHKVPYFSSQQLIFSGTNRFLILVFSFSGGLFLVLLGKKTWIWTWTWQLRKTLNIMVEFMIRFSLPVLHTENGKCGNVKFRYFGIWKMMYDKSYGCLRVWEYNHKFNHEVWSLLRLCLGSFNKLYVCLV